MILTVLGARPQFIKASVVSRAFQLLNLQETIVHTGQHYDIKMSEVFWDELNIPPCTVNLNVGSGLQGLQTANIIEKLERFIMNMASKPVCLLVYGDTNSTLAASIVASKMNIPIVHVEAGLRSFNRLMPEEINRIVTDHLSKILFCSSEISVERLKQEGINSGVYLCGDVMYDAVLQFSDLAVRKNLLSDLTSLSKNEFCLLTLHRPSNTDNLEKLKSILQHLGYLETTILWPIHPRLRSKLDDLEVPTNVITTEPFSYLQMLVILRNCYKVFTDSGGLQKEAYWLKKPCITLRTETEWVETLHDGWNILCDSVKNISPAFASSIAIDSWKPLYGDGKAALKISNILKNIFF